MISIHAPRVGRDYAIGGIVNYSYTISIHAPRVGRDQLVGGVETLFKISIHAPRVGRDFDAPFFFPSAALFQSTRPVWGATEQSNPGYHWD